MKTKTFIITILFLFSLLQFGNAQGFEGPIDTLSSNIDSIVLTGEFIEVLPEFPGGQEALFQFIKDNIKYPNEARKEGIQGTTYISFVIEKDGSISNIKWLRGIGAGCEEESMRVISMMPKWSPGTQRGKEVRCRFILPVKYTLEGNTDSRLRMARKELKAQEKQKKKEEKARAKMKKKAGKAVVDL